MTIADPIDIAVEVSEVLETLAVPYVTGGALASAVWNEGRPTRAIELVADLRIPNVPEFIRRLQPEFLVTETAVREAISAQSGFTLQHHATQTPVNIFIVKDDRFSQSVLSRRTPKLVRFNPERSLWVPSLEDIILEKLIAYRNREADADEQWRDVVWTIKAQNRNLDFPYLREWAIDLKVKDLLDRALAEAGFDPL